MLERYEVGRNSLREALRLLEVSGLLRIRMGAGGGPEVADRSGDQLSRSMRLYFQTLGVTFRDVVTARRTLEPLVAREAAEHGSPEFKDRLFQLALGEANHKTQFTEAAREFHDLLVSHNPSNPILALFVKAVSQVYADLVRTRGPREVRPDHDDIDAEHVAIATAIADGDGDSAERLMARHLADLAEYVESQYAMSLDDVVEWT
ncbi:MAG TPA: FCD domain-containing protein [Ilumatobacteraceae bacterium]|nr:FCD domain-containing protein [Ilumatobacteraceae bacterium]